MPGCAPCIGVQQRQPAAIEAGRQDHAFADAEAHLARRQVGDEHHAAADQLFRFGVAGADAGKDLALAELAGIQLEAQQLVGALDEPAVEHLADAQVELGEVVDADERARASPSAGAGCGAACFAAAGLAAAGVAVAAGAAASVSLLASVMASICFGSMRVNRGL